MTSVQIHLASMDIKLEDAVKQMQASTRHLERIERYTKHCERLEDIADDIKVLARDGIKVK